jgi:hypothetical protein
MIRYRLIKLGIFAAKKDKPESLFNGAGIDP